MKRKHTSQKRKTEPCRGPHEHAHEERNVAENLPPPAAPPQRAAGSGDGVADNGVALLVVLVLAQGVGRGAQFLPF